MSSLKIHEKPILEKLFNRGGFVLDFTDPTFAEFFREHKVNIDHDKYRFNGNSKMKRLRAFWEIEPDTLVGKVLSDLLLYACEIDDVNDADKNKCRKVINRLTGNNMHIEEKGLNEQDFLAKEYKVNLEKLNIDCQLQTIIEQRINEIHKTLKANAALSVIFLCGSTLEGLLLDAATKNAKKFNQAKSAQKDKDGKIRPFHDWTLQSLIDTAHEIGLLSLDIKKFSHTLRDFRNYIHPRQQAVQNFNPDTHTAKISWQVLQAAIANLCGQRNE